MGTNHKKDLPLRDPKTGRFVGTKSSPMPKAASLEPDCRDVGTLAAYDTNHLAPDQLRAQHKNKYIRKELDFLFRVPGLPPHQERINQDSNTQAKYEIWARERERAEALARVRQEERELRRAVWRAILIVLTLFAITLGVLATTRYARADELYTMTHLRQLEQCQLMLVAHDTIRTVTDQASLEPTQVKPISDMFRLFKSKPSEAKKLQDFLTRLTCEEILIMTRTIQ